MQECKQEDPKIVSLIKMAKNLPSVSSPLKFKIFSYFSTKTNEPQNQKMYLRTYVPSQSSDQPEHSWVCYHIIVTGYT